MTSAHTEQVAYYRELCRHLLDYGMHKQHAEVSSKLADLTKPKTIWDDDEEEKEETNPGQNPQGNRLH